jgi:peptide deformylase
VLLLKTSNYLQPNSTPQCAMSGVAATQLSAILVRLVCCNRRGPRVQICWEPEMSILKIARMGHPVLLERCQPVPDPGAPEIRRLVRDMFETMEDAPGAGLAAPQVHVPLRLFVFRVLPSRASGVEDDTIVGNTVLINPQVEPLADDKHLRWEGCLSIPGLRAAVPRYKRIRYTGVDCDGRQVAAEVSGFHAGVVQHENDHLDGILYPARMTDFGLMGFNEEIAKFEESAASLANRR